MAGIPVVIQGELWRTDLSVGGGPVLPEGPGETPPGSPPSIWPGVPTHPIVIPPDFIAPGYPAHPIVIPPVIWPSPGHPAHPIVIPPDLPVFGDAHPEHPIVIPPPTSIWPGGTPTHPIVLPPDSPPEPMPNWQVKAYWTEENGWGVALIPTESHPGVPTPSAAAPKG